MLGISRNFRYPGLKSNLVTVRCFTTTLANFNSTTTTEANDGSSDFEKRINASMKKVESFKKRFWKQVTIGEEQDGYSIQLDGRKIKTPNGSILLIPKHKPTFAHIVASEWDLQKTVLKPHTLPLTSLVSRSIDTFQLPKPKLDAVNLLTKYLNTDTCCYPQKLNEIQLANFTPILNWFKEEYNVDIQTTTSILGKKPNPEIKKVLLDKVLTYDPLALAGFERATIASKSFLIAIALMEKRLSVEEAAKVASLELDYQLEHWGSVEDSHDVDHADLRRQLGSAALTTLSEK